MTKIKVQTDCGNSPKREFLKVFNIAFPKGDVDFIMDHISENIRWEMVGQKVIVGKKDMQEELKAGKKSIMNEFELSSVITHGKEASASGTFTMKNGKTYKFCDVYKFQGTKNIIAEIESYVIEVK